MLSEKTTRWNSYDTLCSHFYRPHAAPAGQAHCRFRDGHRRGAGDCFRSPAALYRFFCGAAGRNMAGDAAADACGHGLYSDGKRTGIFRRGIRGSLACRRAVQHGIYAERCQERNGGTGTVPELQRAVFSGAAEYVRRRCLHCCMERCPLGTAGSGNQRHMVCGGVSGGEGTGTDTGRSCGDYRLQLRRLIGQLLAAGIRSAGTHCRSPLFAGLRRCRRGKDGRGNDRRV